MVKLGLIPSTSCFSEYHQKQAMNTDGYATTLIKIACGIIYSFVDLLYVFGLHLVVLWNTSGTELLLAVLRGVYSARD